MSARVMSNTAYEQLRRAVRAEMRKTLLTTPELARALHVERHTITRALAPTPDRQPRLLLLLAAYLGIEPTA